MQNASSGMLHATLKLLGRRSLFAVWPYFTVSKCVALDIAALLLIPSSAAAEKVV